MTPQGAHHAPFSLLDRRADGGRPDRSGRAGRAAEPHAGLGRHDLHGDLRGVRPGHRRRHLPWGRGAGVVARLLRVRSGLPDCGGGCAERVSVPAVAHVAAPRRPQPNVRAPGRVRHGSAIAERPGGFPFLCADRSRALVVADRRAGRGAGPDLPGPAGGSSRGTRTGGAVDGSAASEESAATGGHRLGGPGAGRRRRGDPIRAGCRNLGRRDVLPDLRALRAGVPGRDLRPRSPPPGRRRRRPLRHRLHVPGLRARRVLRSCHPARS